ncbi:MAG TPA: pantoate--beta-alanine ligase [Candidatus Kapabacteria bacterium]
MRTITTTTELRRALTLLREQNPERTIGFVPTMGALHEGHLSLVGMSKKETDVTVVSIFVNPTQFGPTEDFSKYPRTFESDAAMLIEEDVEFLFAPTVDQIYPNGPSTSVHVGGVTALYEGARRLGHFDGVATIVSILFHIVQPDFAYFGQKDAQQLSVIRKLVRDLAFPIEIIAGKTLREKDGLAMSSRNRFLNSVERNEARALSITLNLVKEFLLAGKPMNDAKEAGVREFQRISPSGKLDYLDIVNSETFQSIASFEEKKDRENSITIIIASYIGATRLIDNIQI